MSRWIRATFLLLLAAIVLPVAATGSTAAKKKPRKPAPPAAHRMPIGFYDDGSFRWSADRLSNLAAAAAAGATIIHTNASWSTIAPTRPADPSNGDDPAYVLADLDQLVAAAPQYGLRVMVTIVGTPKWANGNQTPNHMPKKLSDLTTFAKMLANRYDGQHGHGTVAIWSAWNEPNLSLFLTPQYSGKKIVSPALYVKLYKSIYAGIHAGNPSAAVAIGETSPEGRDKPTAKAGQGQSVAPATFAQMVARTKGLKFNAWAEHPYPTSINGKALGKAKYPNVVLTNLKRFESDLDKWFKRDVSIWITEYGHQTKPQQPHGVTYAQQAAYAKQALTYAKNDPNVQMFVWFTFRDSATAAMNPWRSGLETSTGAHKPAFAAFAKLARSIRGTTQTVTVGAKPTVVLYVPMISYYSPLGSTVGITYTIRNQKGVVFSQGEPQASLGPDQTVAFHPNFVADRDDVYTVTASVNDASGHVENVVASLVPLR